jgi:hypothetical protein
MRDSILKVCFMLDCTASMGPWIEAAKNRILDLLDDLRDKHENFKIYVAFVGYRDFGEQNHTFNFTTNDTQIYNTITSIHAMGGGDAAEDVAGAYKWVNNLEWNADIRAVFHITDAPNHGMVYHDNRVSDDYPDGHATIDLRDEVRKLARRDIDLTLFRIHKSTDIMYGLMRENYTRIRPDGFKIVNFINSGQTPDDAFYEQISSQLHYSMSQYDPTD